MEHRSYFWTFLAKPSENTPEPQSGAASMPFNIAVEVEATFAVD